MIWGLLNFDPKDERSVEQWAMWHFTDHVEIQQEIENVFGIDLQIWEIYPFDPRKWEEWAAKHQSAHNEMNRVSQLAGSDLTEVDFNDSKEREEWHRTHFNEHLAQRTKYGI